MPLFDVQDCAIIEINIKKMHIHSCVHLYFLCVSMRKTERILFSGTRRRKQDYMHGRKSTTYLSNKIVDTY